jgi:predicted SprT family Zn-dependent metalloprotease
MHLTRITLPKENSIMKFNKVQTERNLHLLKFNEIKKHLLADLHVPKQSKRIRQKLESWQVQAARFSIFFTTRQLLQHHNLPGSLFFTTR